MKIKVIPRTIYTVEVETGLTVAEASEEPHYTGTSNLIDALENISGPDTITDDFIEGFLVITVDDVFPHRLPEVEQLIKEYFK